MSTTAILGIAVLVLLLAAIVLFNRLVHDRSTVRAAWSDIDVQLKRRHELLPKLAEVVKAYAQHEAGTLEAVTALREARAHDGAGAAKAGPLESMLSAQLRRLYVLVEDYPELKADGSFLDLQKNISAVEKDIHFARRFYNGAVRNLNVRCEAFPSNLVARLFGFTQAQYFEFDPT